MAIYFNTWARDFPVHRHRYAPPMAPVNISLYASKSKFNIYQGIMMPSCQYRKSHCRGKTVARSSYPYNGFPILIRWHLYIKSTPVVYIYIFINIHIYIFTYIVAAYWNNNISLCHRMTANLYYYYHMAIPGNFHWPFSEIFIRQMSDHLDY